MVPDNCRIITFYRIVYPFYQVVSQANGIRNYPGNLISLFILMKTAKRKAIGDNLKNKIVNILFKSSYTGHTVVFNN